MEPSPWLPVVGTFVAVSGIVLTVWGVQRADTIAQLVGVMTAGLGVVIALPHGRDESVEVWDRLLLWKYPALVGIGLLTIGYGVVSGALWAIGVGLLQVIVGAVARWYRL